MSERVYRPGSTSLDLDATIDVEGPRCRISVRGSGNTLEARLDGLGSCFALAGGGIGPHWRKRDLARAHHALRRSGLSVDIRCGRWRILRLGDASRGTLFGRLAGVPGAALGLLGLTCFALAAVGRLGVRDG